METLTLARPEARALRGRVLACRDDLGAQAARLGGDCFDATFWREFSERLVDEVLLGDPGATDQWIAVHQAADRSVDLGRHVVLACSLLANSAASLDEGPAIAHYLALRGRALDTVCKEVAAGRASSGSCVLVERSEVVTALLAALTARDEATCQHSQAVGSWSERIAGAFGMPAGECTFIGLSGTLHDIGKLSTPRAILLKAGPLDEDEWDVMREHSARGAGILDEIRSLQPCAPIVRSHHEQIDGRGYPDGLAGDRLPLAARIVAVADAFHAMISKRSYRPAMPAAQAVAILQQGAGTRWDQRVVEVMVGLVRPASARSDSAIVGGRARS
jgi:HD-GYP domain-containing protein (c-di-GMP phosphodiesterase class II)